MTDLSPTEIERYSRQILLPAIGALGQIRLKNATVLVTGAGGIGAHLLPHLVGSGIGEIVICDFDKIELSNLPRQTLYAQSDIGSPKVEAAYKRLKDLNPDVKIHTVTDKFSPDLFDRFDFDVVCDGTDDPKTRGSISDLCRARKIPLVTGALGGFSGQWITFDYRTNNGACLRCLYPNLDAVRPGGCAFGGIISPVCGVVAGMMAAKVIEILTDPEKSHAPVLHLWHAFDGNIDRLAVPKNVDCRHVP